LKLLEPQQKFTCAKWLGLGALAIFVAALSLAWGTSASVRDLWGDESSREVARRIFFELRPPRVAAAFLVGANLAAAGAALQSAFRNPLAEPYLLGTSSGGALGAVLGLWIGLNVPDFSSGWAGIGLVSMLAWAGSLAASFLVSRLGQSRKSGELLGGPDRATLLLCGVALSSLLSALMSLVTVLSPNPNLAQQLSFWLLGGLSEATWTHDAFLLISLIIGLAILLSSARDLNATLLGDEEALALGVDAARLHRRLLLAASLMSATAVACAGLIGFVGLLAPHAMRQIFGHDARAIVPASALGGAILLASCDALARFVLPPTEIPVGILTALLGVPLFLWLVRK
jgi:iron complex transport system permease protein